MPWRELEGDVEDDVAAGVGLEPGGAVAEAAVGVGERADAVQPAVPDPDLRDRLGDLLAVRADVLDRGRADRAGDAGERLDADPAALDRACATSSSQTSPAATRHHHAAAGESPSSTSGRTPRVATSTTGAVEPLVGDHEVAAAAEHQHRLAGAVGGGDGRDQLGLGRRA